MSKFKVLIGIPARLGGERLPDKVLADVCGKPLLWYTWQRVKASVDPEVCLVMIVTPSKQVVDVAGEWEPGLVHLDTKLYRNGSKRVVAMAESLPGRYDAVVNVQADEPWINRETLTAVIRSLQGDVTDIVTAACDWGKAEGEDEVSVVGRRHRVYDCLEATHFSRVRMPGSKRHVGLYGFSDDGLVVAADSRGTLLSAAERLEQLEWESRNILVANVSHGPRYAINTQADLERFRADVKAGEWQNDSV